MRLTYALTLASRRIGLACSASAADCAPICASSFGEKRLNPALILVCALAMPTLSINTTAAAAVLLRFIPGLLLMQVSDQVGKRGRAGGRWRRARRGQPCRRRHRR